MTTAGTIITAAFREGNIVPVGTSPSAAEQAEGLDALNRLVLSAFGFTIGNQLREWQIPQQQRTGTVSRTYPMLPGSDVSLVPTYPLYPPPNSRIVWDGSAQAIFLQEEPADGAVMGLVKGSGAGGAIPGVLTIDGNGRTIAGANTVASSALNLPVRWFYRADYADWRTVAPVLATDDMLFPPELDDLWICSLAIRLAPRFGKTIAASTSARFAEMTAVFRSRYQQTAPTPSGGDDMRPLQESFSNLRWML